MPVLVILLLLAAPLAPAPAGATAPTRASATMPPPTLQASARSPSKEPPATRRTLAPDTVLSPPGGPTIAYFPTAASEVVSIRVSVPLEEAPEEAGVGELLRIQARDRMEGLAGRIGAMVEVRRRPGALVYSVSGSLQDLDFLGWILREGMAEPDARAIEAARREVRIDLERRLETPEGTLALRLLEDLVPDEAPLHGRPGTLDRLQIAHVRAAWARSHQRSRVRVVVAGRGEPTLLLATLSDLGIPDDEPTSSAAPSQPTGDARGAPEVNRHWVTRAWLVEPDAGPRAAVAARYLGRLLRGAPGDYEASVGLWDTGRAHALVITGAAYDRSRSVMEDRVAGLLDEAVGALSEEAVSVLAAEIAVELRVEGRSPWGMAELVGNEWDQGAGPDGAGRLFEELERVEATDVRRFLEALAGREPVQAELRP